MKITKTSDRVAFLNNAKMVANKGCNRCPCCGETKSSMEYTSIGEWHKGIISGLSKSWVTGLLWMKNMRCDCYSCLTCGAEWESDPYEW